MQHFTQLGNIDIIPLLLQIERNPELWNEEGGRRERSDSPHNGLGDIWLRYRTRSELHDQASYNEKFFPCIWYPAYQVLSEVKPILQLIMTRIGGTALGGTLITKIPPGGAVKPHSDALSWHANYYNTKVYVTIKSNPNVVNWCSGESLVFKPSEVWTFDNLKEHSVYNEGADDRITLMTAIRSEF